MACLITISPNVEQIVISGNPVIKVEGTADSCGKVIVKIKCSNTFEIPEVSVPVNDGKWFAFFPNQGCSCEKSIEVTATCTTDPLCSASITSLLHCPSNCPSISVNVEEGVCNGVNRNVIFNVTIDDAAGFDSITTQLDFGDGSFSLAETLPGLGSYQKEHLYGTAVNNNAFLIILIPKNCLKIRIPIPELNSCFICPVQDDILVNAGACDKNTNKTTYSIRLRTFGFGQTTAAIDHGDGSGGGLYPVSLGSIFTFPSHDYMPRDESYVITVRMANCPPAHAFTGVVKPCEEITPPPASSAACFIARMVVVLLSALAIILGALALCFPALAETLLILAAAAAAGAILVYVIQYLLVKCPDPCGKWYLFGWQTSITAAIGLLYYSNCCQSLLWAGLAFLTAAIGFFYGWIRACHPTKCDIVRELLVVLSTLLLPIIGSIANVGVLQECISPIGDTILFIINGIIAAAAGICLLNTAADQGNQTQ